MEIIQDLAFLTDADLHRLTGYKRPGKQAAWLSQQNIRHYINACGKPVVLRSTLEGVVRRPKPVEGPRLEHLHAAQNKVPRKVLPKTR